MSMSFAWNIYLLILFSPFCIEQEMLNRQVLQFAQSHVGKSIGRGECWDLAQQALTHAKAKNSTDFLPQTRNENYIWGSLVSLDRAKGGDVIQYRNFRGKVREVLPSGSWKELSFLAQHHTAILGRALSEGRWEVYHQNNQGQRFVTRDTIHLLNTRYQQGDSKIQVEVEGKFWIYRPVAQ